MDLSDCRTQWWLHGNPNIAQSTWKRVEIYSRPLQSTHILHRWPSNRIRIKCSLVQFCIANQTEACGRAQEAKAVLAFHSDDWTRVNLTGIALQQRNQSSSGCPANERGQKPIYSATVCRICFEMSCGALHLRAALFHIIAIIVI